MPDARSPHSGWISEMLAEYRARIKKLVEQLEATEQRLAREISEHADAQAEYRRLVEQLEVAGRLVDRAALLLQNSTPPRHERWHDDFDQWLADARASNPAKRPT